MAYIYAAPGVANVQPSLTMTLGSGSGNVLTVPALQDVTVNNANDVFTWTQLDEGSKKQVATTATNSLSMNIVLDRLTFFGNVSAGAGTAGRKGVFGISKDKDLVPFSLRLGADSGNVAQTVTVTGNAYVTGLAPTTSADAPVWVSPITLTVDGDYGVTLA